MKKYRKKALEIVVLLLVFAVVLVVAVSGIIGGYKAGKKTTASVQYGTSIYKYSAENNLDPYLVMAVIKVESNFIPTAQSDYAYGLMQLTEETAHWNAANMGLRSYDWKDPDTNIRIGCHYLKYLIDKYGSRDTALAAYNGGMGNIDTWLGDKRYSPDGKTLKDIPFSETRKYVEKVNTARENYKKAYSGSNAPTK